MDKLISAFQPASDRDDAHTKARKNQISWLAYNLNQTDESPDEHHNSVMAPSQPPSPVPTPRPEGHP